MNLCDGCKIRIHLTCCGISEQEFNFYGNNEYPFYCVNELELNTVGNDCYCKTCFKNISYLDDCLFCDANDLL